MSELKLEFVGKQVKDMYGTLMGNVVGIITDTDGSIESVSVDCGDSGLKQLSYEQLLVQGDYVIFIPKWRLDAQKLFRQKNLTLKRIKALQLLVEEDDSMKEDAEIVYIKYEKKLHELEEKEKLLSKKGAFYYMFDYEKYKKLIYYSSNDIDPIFGNKHNPYANILGQR